MANCSTEAEKADTAISGGLGFWFDQDKVAVKEAYGFPTFLLVNQAYDFAVNLPVDWSAETLEAAVDRVKAAVQQKYPWLSDKSAQVLGNHFAYS
ncbi:hypothetical protein [Hymenobacter sp.]|jgi:hypothetical protein|uniref:hypothetical protein n=1 Tax=Hymenobacter sp. TaxID=1898978 RepID=UPI002EDB1802